MPDLSVIREGIERRTEEGKLLRAAFDAIEIPEGKTLQLVSVFTKDRGLVAVAVKTKSGLEFKAKLESGLTKATAKDFSLTLGVSR